MTHGVGVANLDGRILLPKCAFSCQYRRRCTLPMSASNSLLHIYWWQYVQEEVAIVTRGEIRAMAKEKMRRRSVHVGWWNSTGKNLCC